MYTERGWPMASGQPTSSARHRIGQPHVERKLRQAEDGPPSALVSELRDVCLCVCVVVNVGYWPSRRTIRFEVV